MKLPQTLTDDRYSIRVVIETPHGSRKLLGKRINLPLGKSFVK